MFDLLSAHTGALAAIAALVAGAALLTSRWEPISLWLLSTWHSLPLVGGIAWLARRSASRQGSDRTQAEQASVLALCGSYARFVRVLNRADYDRYMNYLRKAGDLGRRPFPPILWFVIFSMVIVEAAGLAYVLAGWTLPGASEFIQQVAAGGIGFLIAVILVFFTHWAGVEIYQSNQYRRDRSEWMAAGCQGPLYGPDLSLNDAQDVDDHEPGYRQRATRGHGKTSYFLTAVTIFMVLAIGGGAAFVRGQVLEQELAYEVAGRARAVARFESSLPGFAEGSRAGADREAIAEEILIKRRGGWGTLVVLAIIFFFLQLLGMFFGYRYAFNGRLSRDAYRALQADRFSSYSELLHCYDRIADIAQSKVERLQQLIEQRRSGGIGVSSRVGEYSFRDYLQTRDAHRRDKPLGGGIEASPATAATPAAGAMPATVWSVPAEQPETPAQRAARPQAQWPAETAAEAPAVGSDAGTDEPRAATEAAFDARTLLDQAERAERRRAAERTARGRARATQPGKKGPALKEPEPG